jgi:hypothetical protein
MELIEAKIKNVQFNLSQLLPNILHLKYFSKVYLMKNLIFIVSE